MANNRIFYACQSAAINHREYNDTTGTWSVFASSTAHQCEGLQSVGINTNFNLEQIFELGQLGIYENVEGIPEVEVTMEKALDGKRLLYHCCSTEGESVTQTTQDRADIGIKVYADSGNADGGSGIAEVIATGMYISNISYTFPVEGNSTESLTFVGNAKVWQNAGGTAFSGKGIASLVTNPSGTPTGEGAPASDGVTRRENFQGHGSTSTTSRIPATVRNAGNLQSVTVSSDFSREDIMSLGSKTPYYRAAGFPIEVSCEFEVVATNGDKVNCEEASDNIGNEEIIIRAGNTTSQQITLNLGNRNKLTSISYGGGDATGGNATITFGYINYNHLVVNGPDLPAGATPGS
tara:strand:- start:54 stop:1103 length:1050 start_codon:yes stop_codon:yes gene_type:complete